MAKPHFAKASRDKQAGDVAVEVVVDDTLFRRSGRKVHAAWWQHDGSGPVKAKFGYGNCWVIVGVVVWLPVLARRGDAAVWLLASDGGELAGLIRLRCGDTVLLARVTARGVHELGLQVGMPAWAQVKSVALVK